MRVVVAVTVIAFAVLLWIKHSGHTADPHRPRPPWE